MEQIDINQINKIIINSNFDWYNSNYLSTYTPPINELKVNEPSKNICSRDDAHYVMDKFINPENVNRPIYDDELNAVYNFMLGENVPSDLKEKLSVYLTEEMKEHIFNEYITKVLPKTKILLSYEDYDDFGNRITNMKYVPKHNHVPLRYYFKNQENSIIHRNFEIEYTRILKAVNNNYKDLTPEELYSLKHFFKDVDFFDDKWLPSSALNIKRNLNNQEWIEAEEKLCNENDKLITEKVKNSYKRTDKEINDNISNEIINSIPYNFSQLEKTIYVYSKLCKLLSYDSVYFITEDKSSDILDVDGIDKFDKNNNYVVCHHFAYMLSDILRKIGVENIEENISINNINGKMQFTGHSNIRYCLDENIIFADSTKSVIGGDLTNHKFQNNLSGIRCELYDEAKQLEFHEAKTKVEKYIEYEDLNNKNKLPNKDECDSLSLKEKYIVFNNYIYGINLYGIDLISYANSLIQLLDLNINTKIMYKSDDLGNILLGVEIDSYLEDGSSQKISYLIDTTTKQIYNGIDSTISFKESLTNKTR